MQVIILTRIIGISIEIIFHWQRCALSVLLMPNRGTSLLLMERSERRRHFGVATIRHVIRSLVCVIKLLLVMVVGLLLWHDKVLLVRHVDRLRWIVVAVIVVTVCRRVLRMRHKLMVLVECRELHRRRSRNAASERWRRVSERQWGRVWCINRFSIGMRKNFFFGDAFKLIEKNVHKKRTKQNQNAMQKKTVQRRTEVDTYLRIFPRSASARLLRCCGRCRCFRYFRCCRWSPRVVSVTVASA